MKIQVKIFNLKVKLHRKLSLPIPIVLYLPGKIHISNSFDFCQPKK